MARWPYNGSFPKQSDKIWKRLSIETDVVGDIVCQRVLLDGKRVPLTGPQGWDCHAGRSRLKPAAYKQYKENRKRWDKRMARLVVKPSKKRKGS